MRSWRGATAIAMVTAAIWLDVATQIQGNPSAHRRNNKAYFSNFKVLHFKDQPCESTNMNPSTGEPRIGRCLSPGECKDLQGRKEGSCAEGFGVCCLFVIDTSEGGAVSQNGTYLQNPDFPSATSFGGEYAYRVEKCDYGGDICSVRLDFETFTVAGTGVTDETAGCDRDRLTVESHGLNIPVICGENSGQHIYIEVETEGGRLFSSAIASFSLHLSPVDAFSRMWDIRVTQLECSNPSLPPNGCLQYATGLNGRFETFNFRSAGETHLPNQEYSFCVRPEAGFCCVQYQVCHDDTDGTAFSLLVNDGHGGEYPSHVDSECFIHHQLLDHLEIAGSTSASCGGNRGNVALDNKYCGSALNDAGLNVNAPVCDCTPPFFVHVFTDHLPDSGTPTAPNVASPINRISRGACLEYMQIPC